MSNDNKERIVISLLFIGIIIFAGTIVNEGFMGFDRFETNREIRKQKCIDEGYEFYSLTEKEFENQTFILCFKEIKETDNDGKISFSSVREWVKLYG